MLNYISMKILLLAACLSMFNLSSLADGQIPAPVRAAFAKLYPEIEASEVFWECSKEGIVATFETERRLTKAFFDEAGTWKESRIRLYLNQMPLPLQKLLEKHFREADITFMGKVLFPDGSQLFRVESEYYEEVVIKLLDQKGTLISEEHIPFTEGLEVW